MKMRGPAINGWPKRLALTVGLLLALPMRGPAAVPQYTTRLWQMEDGLPHTVVQAITQARDGYLWVGTREGLARFDGVRFQAIALGSGLVQPSVTCLAEDQHGSLWIGTQNAGLFRLQEGKVARFGTAEGLPSDNILGLQRTTDGALWIGSIRGLAQAEEGKIRRCLEKDIKGAVWSLFGDQEGSLWIALPGLARFMEGRLVPYRAEGFPASVKCVLYDRAGTLWSGNNDGLFCVRDGKTIRYKKADGPLGVISVLYQDREGTLWVGTYGGLSRFVEGKFVNESQNDAAFYRVFSIFEDREGNLWTGSEEGLTRLTPRHFTSYTREHGLRQNSIASVCADKDGGAWVAAWGGGVNHLVNGQVTQVLDRSNGLPTDFILSVLEARDGSLWVGNDYYFGVNHVRNGENIHYGRAEGLVGTVVSVMLEDHQGNLWLGSRDALNCFKDGRFTRFTTSNGLTHNKINALCEGQEGVVWVGTEAGLTVWRDGRFIDCSVGETRLKTVVLSLYEDAERTLWIGTREAGVLRLGKGHIDAFTCRQGLFNDCIYAIVEDARTNLWFNSSKGFFRVSKRQFEEVARGTLPALAPAVYGRADGIVSSSQYREPTQPAASKGPDGRIWFRSTQGVVVVDPARITANEVPPPVVIEEILSDKQPLNQLTNTHAESGITFPPSRGELEIHYTALNFRAPERVQFRYKLEGFDRDWVEAGSRRVAYYNNLRPGDYSFHVTACNEDGVWRETGAAVGLTLQPHFWQTWWFLGAGVCLAAGAIAGGVRYETWRRMGRKLERLEQQYAVEQERVRIARDLHDNLGTRLTEILMLNECPVPSGERPPAADKPQPRISKLVRELADNLDAIVWATNPKNDSLDNFVLYLLDYLDGLADASPVRILRDVPSGLPHCAMSSVQRHNLFLVIKEALNNVFKHASASQVQFRLRLEDGLLTMSLEDNGRGFVPKTTLELGNGLVNMEKRMKLIGGNFAVASEPGGGTRVRLAMPINNGGRNGA